MKIFATVGAQMPFDRLLDALEGWAAAHPSDEVFAQIGQSDFQSGALRTVRFLEPATFARACDDADAIVGHAGTGTLFAALERAKPLLVMPRHAALRETRNDHQIATARQFVGHSGVFVAWNEDELPLQMEALRSAIAGGVDLLPAPTANSPLLSAIGRFIDDPAPKRGWTRR